LLLLDELIKISIVIQYYRYEDDPVLGHRLYREIRKVETPKIEGKKSDTKKRKGRPPLPPPPIVTYEWEAVATNLDEFQEVSVDYLCRVSFFFTMRIII
jgi:hypothetical protein